MAVIRRCSGRGRLARSLSARLTIVYVTPPIVTVSDRYVDAASYDRVLPMGLS